MKTFKLRRPRAVLYSLSIIAAVSAVAVFGMSANGFQALPGLFGGTVESTVGEVEFSNELKIPELATSTVDASGARHFELTPDASSTEFTAGVKTPTWGFNGSYLGPTLIAERGEQVVVDVTNALDEATTVHWHGMLVPAAMDGGPHQMIEPGETWSPTWQIDQPAATLWYHPHPHGSTEEHVARGLAGLFIVTDPIEKALDLPRDYGVDDIPIVVQDVRFDSAGQFEYRGGMIGSIGNQILVNGTLAPYFNVTTTVVRLRIVNASTARIYNFGFSDGRQFDQIASDGGLLEAPVATDQIRLSPGERAEVTVTMTAGESAVLQSTEPPLGSINLFGGPDGSRDQFDILELRAADTLREAAGHPSQLANIERLDARDATEERTFVLDGLSINDQTMDLTRVDETVTAGSTEVWNVLNDMARPHNFHIHGFQFQVLSLDEGPTPPALAGWKDTIYLEPGVRYRLIMRFDGEPDPNHAYMYHCHLLRHEDAGMMGQFVVVNPGETAGEIDDSLHGGH